MKAELKEIVEICEATENKHFKWFSKLINRHFNGMAAHVEFRLSNAKIEGINNKIKTLRRQGYGYPDDEYFFLKIIDVKSTSETRHHTEKVIEPRFSESNSCHRPDRYPWLQAAPASCPSASPLSQRSEGRYCVADVGVVASVGLPRGLAAHFNVAGE